MRPTFLPKTTPGKWSVGFGIVFTVLICLKLLCAMPLPTFSIAALGLVGSALALVAFFRMTDRSLLGLLPILAGVVILLWTTAELMFPH